MEEKDAKKEIWAISAQVKTISNSTVSQTLTSDHKTIAS